MSHSLLCTNDNNLCLLETFYFGVISWFFPQQAGFQQLLSFESSWQSCWLFWWCEGNRFLFSLHAFRPQQHVNVCVSGRLTVCDVLSMGVSRKLSEMAARPSITAKQRRINTHTHLHSCTVNSNISTATSLMDPGFTPPKTDDLEPHGPPAASGLIIAAGTWLLFIQHNRCSFYPWDHANTQERVICLSVHPSVIHLSFIHQLSIYPSIYSSSIHLSSTIRHPESGWGNRSS